jgi:Raf kinase inhibitor-like YbhB/YbcL family protein
MRSNFYLLTAASAALCLTVAVNGAVAADLFTLKSATFEDGKLMPKKVANGKANMANNPNCVGDNVSPELSWSNTPDGTKSFVLTMFDPEGRAPGGVSHWVAYGIPPSVTGFAEGEVSKPTNNYVGGKSTMGVGFYSGPCTPPNTTPHHYTFILTATDFGPQELPPGLTREELVAKFTWPSTHVKGSTGIVGLFVNPYRE